ncbi:MAG: hypothetical protein WAU91_14235 [Desulfatitalea sp.]
MVSGLHRAVVEIVHQAIGIMDDLLRDRIDMQAYARGLKALDADSLLEAHQQEFKRDPKNVCYLDALMIISSLQHELDFQVAEYGANVASEDIKMLKELLPKFEDMQS